jgi:hypothetical protein
MTEGTVKLVANGEVRLSSDLITAERYFVAIVEGSKSILLIPSPELKAHRASGTLKVYYSNSRAKSGRISLGPFLRAIGLNLKSLSDKEYPASMTDGKVVISFA